ncbi:MAG: hypothetical protein LBT21_05005 [Oscillospiraceae bacterium]|jgi:hypothetical protein|nr:hypothetical protein [Oscillospiraceae bacterium]
MKRAIKLCVVLALILSVFTVCYAAAYQARQEPATLYDYSQIQPQITAGQAEVLASMRIGASGAGTVGYSWVAHQSVGTRQYPPYYQYTPDNLTWFVTYYPKGWNGKDEDIVNCLFGELNGLTGKALYAGKCTLTGEELRREIERDGERQEAEASVNEQGEILRTWEPEPTWQVSEYFLPDGNIRILKPLNDEKDKPQGRVEYYTYNPKTEKVSDRLTFWPDREKISAENIKNGMTPSGAVIVYALTDKKFINEEWTSNNDIWSQGEGEIDGLRLDVKTLLPF